MVKLRAIFIGIFLSISVGAALLAHDEPRERKNNLESRGNPLILDILQLEEKCPIPSELCQDSTLPPPFIPEELPPYINNDTISLEWEPVWNDPRVHDYYAVACLDSECTMVNACASKEHPCSTAILTVSSQGTIWCRVYSVRPDTIYGLCLSPPSNAVRTIIDMTPPVIDSLILMNKDTDIKDREGTNERKIDVVCYGHDLPEDGGACASIMLSEGASFFDSDPIPINSTCCDAIEFTLSPHQERKTVIGKLIDRAGNVSDTLSASIIYTRKLYNYPNPFIPAEHTVTNIVYWLSKQCNVVYIDIYDSFGSHVCRISGGGSKGFNTVTWDGHNANGDLVANGGYLCVLKGDRKYTHKIAVLK